jgi:GT2 family glycosyltransferase
VVIATKNRKDDLRNAVASALKQTAPVEVIVLDDGSTDGTSELVRQQFPQVRLHRSDTSQGYIVQRNRGAELASTPIIFSLDDDAAFPSPRTVEQTLAEFDHSRVGAVAIPYIDVNKPPVLQRRALVPGEIIAVTNYIGCAHAVRRDLFLKLGGYHEYLFHQCEEPDYCLRQLGAGYITRLGSADPIHHFESPRRDTARLFIYNARNNLLNAWYNVPMPYLPVHWCGTLLKLIWFQGIRRKHPIWLLRGVLQAFGAIWHERGKRRPVPGSVYRLSRRIVRNGGLPVDQAEPALPIPVPV